MVHHCLRLSPNHRFDPCQALALEVGPVERAECGLPRALKHHQWAHHGERSQDGVLGIGRLIDQAADQRCAGSEHRPHDALMQDFVGLGRRDLLAQEEGHHGRWVARLDQSVCQCVEQPVKQVEQFVA